MLPFAHLRLRGLIPRLLFILFTIACTATADSAHAQEKSAELPAASADSILPSDPPRVVEPSGANEPSVTPTDVSRENDQPAEASNRVVVLIGSLTIFILAIFVGFEIINKVPPTLHTPLMSGSNAISGITVVGAILATGFSRLGFGSFLGFAAIILAMINVAGGFWVTHRMLAMFKKK